MVGRLHLLSLAILLFLPSSGHAHDTCSAGKDSCGSSQGRPGRLSYESAARPTAHLKLPGFTRAVSDPGNQYAVLAPENRVYGPAPAGWVGPASAAAVVTPAMGAHFAMYVVDAKPGARLAKPTAFEGALEGLERIFFVLTGEVTVSLGGELERLQERSGKFGPGAYLYVAPGEAEVDELAASDTGAVLVQIDRVYSGGEGRRRLVKSVLGFLDNVPVEILDGEQFRLQRLLNASDPAYDFNIHVMTFSPGEYLAIKERHYNQHGLLMLEGQGMYMLGSEYMPVQAGDVVWMAPFVAQWFAALGKGESTYFLYKDTNLDPLLHVTAPSFKVGP